MVRFKLFSSMSFLFLLLISTPQVASSFNFDEVEKKKEPQFTVEDVKSKITKEIFFSLMKSKFSKLATIETSNYNLIQILQPNMRYDSSSIIAFDNTGQPVTEWQKKYPDEFLVIPNPYAFDMILTNSYGLKYKTSEYYQKSSDNYKRSYYVCTGKFDAEVADLLKYYINGAEWALDQAKERLLEWKDPKVTSRRGGKGDCFLPTFQFASDYNEFIQVQLDIIKTEKSAEKNKIEKEKEQKRKAEEKRKKEELEQKKLAEQKHQQNIKALSVKWEKFGIPQDMLMSNIATYAGSAASGDITTLVEFLDKLPGATKWKKKGQQFFLHQKNKDQATGKTHKAIWVFYDLRQKQGNIWLERVVIDKQDYPSSQLVYLVMQIISQ